ncbi:MAG TPA: tRNA preQ1(34) S-adenosylmethionine ribosyltransferase-isomerase QueA [Bacillota bacterium]|nr:tRNA preQ1(34) S-adenosylmethionine ribosyltransferase-isomerase QueA [Bacillota bacterium]HPF42438.1 tRNA preQ1(34) S-adenosylmethionine ribosyltransferase-isomerase QueA [Bacillota bacterium]HPJ85696.1 tRNA preQ1(34) S-adenosylmethionine ribosyltransferase-isomerase QueA [Bacillota bacterium]HPQ61667.1 tRNA preQ1(34) S-adenosylmethionine ribosyltransferase-isomerase QueA [Bacillota bacterium]HRX91983.1 tRNA preQ1(34) S-adenosylmethionine ribosyltransferase-isomerase QueA [Candidatus Izemop
MKTSDFDYILPKNLIAQSPLPNRTDSRLLMVNRTNFNLEHRHFRDLPQYLEKGDVLVLNDTKVMPARLIGEKPDTGAHIEILLLRQMEDDVWETLAKPARRIKKESIVSFGQGLLMAKCIEEKDDGIRKMRMYYKGVFPEILDKLGETPLPPYIHEKLEDKNRYQTVYSRELGSAAAPTAGLHFTKALLDEIREKGIETVFLTLHVGLGTFRPVETEDFTKHKMHSEYYVFDTEAAKALNKAKTEKRRIIAVGTTSTRTLESVYAKYGEFRPDSGYTDIFIYPGFQFRAIDGLITNFHLPKSTLMMLVSAFSSREIIFNAYREAIEREYRFFSFGDSMFIR